MNPDAVMEQSKADLHVHTKYSDRPSEWFLRRVGAPESFTEPKDVYRRCKARGMDYVTISDHNRIEGALEIAHLPGTFISTEVTTYFPEDGCKLHVLATGITEEQFRMIDELRTNVYEFRQYAIEQNIILSLAHPLYSVNNILDVDHFEKTLVLFNRFEGINGARYPRACDLAVAICRSLTPDLVEKLSDKHDIAPIGDEPWKKVFTAGSDDHGGQHIASAYTVTPQAGSLEAFLGNLRDGDHDMGGTGGTSLQLAHSFFHIAYSYYKSKLLRDSEGKTSLIAGVLERLLKPIEQPQPRGLRGKVRGVLGGWIMNRKRQRMNETERLLFDELRTLIEHGHGFTTKPDQDALSEAETFSIASRLSHKIGCTLMQRLVERVQKGDLFESIQTIASLGPVALGVTPYLTAMKTQHKDERLLQRIAAHFEATADMELRSNRVAWATDTFSDVNGVTTTIRQLARTAMAEDKPLTVLTCEATPLVDGRIDQMNFEPVGEFELPEYDGLKMAFPPFLSMLEYLERQAFSHIVISTPGPVGLTALVAGRLLGMKMAGIYHTDFPKYAAQLSGDQNMEALTQRYMSWFYDQMDVVVAPSESYRRNLLDAGFAPSKLRVFGRGVDVNQYNPQRRDDAFWKKRGLRDKLTFLYAGRVSAEKNIDLLLASFMQLLARGYDVQLAVVGDGPLLKSVRQRFAHQSIRFTGFMEGDELAAAYASADAFVFPSTTDTFGNVVLEAMASGLPVIVSDKGGPKDTVTGSGAGLIVNADSPGAMVDAMEQLVENEDRRRRMCEAALDLARSRSWSSVLASLWDLTGGSVKTPAPCEARELVEV